jgi:hypothetical protein
MDEVFCFFPSGALAHDCSQKKAFFFEKKKQKTFNTLNLRGVSDPRTRRGRNLCLTRGGECHR